jgi:multiple sugar transport system permease protein
MAAFSETGPRTSVTESIRVDKVGPRAKTGKSIRVTLVLIVAFIGLVPLIIMAMAAFKSRSDIVSVPPKLTFQPTLEGIVFLLTERSQLSRARQEEAEQDAEDLNIFEQVALRNGQIITGPSDFLRRLRNSLIIAGGSTILSVGLGLLAAYLVALTYPARMICCFSFSVHACCQL